MKYLFSILAIISLIFLGAKSPLESEDNPIFNEKTKVSDVLERLGDKSIKHFPNTSYAGVSAAQGENLVKNGFFQTKSEKKSAKQSKHFVCTSCHNLEREDPDLSVADPQARLLYTSQRGIPFLQGTTLYGAVNRTSFYNGDYDKKYGDLVRDARNDIREAIQLCAVECAQGRELNTTELESVLAYLWKLELRLGDLNLDAQEYEQLEQGVRAKGNKKETIELLKSKYLQGSPATFVAPPENRKKGNELIGDPNNGELIYENSCLHCHEESRYSFFSLDHSKFSTKHLSKHFERYTRYSVYQVGRYGTPPMNGKKAYMPQYTEEKMSRQQMEDLRAYLKKASR